MQLHLIDWIIIFCVAVFFIALAYSTKKHMKSTADFLAANRCAGRYLLTMAEGMLGLGAITIVAMWQLTYKAGFASSWWSNLSTPVVLIMALAGWVIYRYRETRVLTMAQFFEIRYSRNFRVLAGVVCWVSGLINFGIFPSVGANFFIYYCGLPTSFELAGLSFSTYHTIIILLVSIALYFTFVGGQVAILITDFFQAFFCNIVLVIILVILLIKFPLKNVFDGLLIAEEGKSMVNPFGAGQSDFSPWFFLIGIVGAVFNRLSWQGSQGFNCSAKSPHEAKMAGVLTIFRSWGFLQALVLIPLIAYMIMHHPDYAKDAARVNQVLSNIDNDQIRDQMLVPVTMTLYMPAGLIGAFAAVMFAAFVSSHESYLHSWGSILVQDVIVPLRRKPLSTKQHMLLLRSSILFVGVFICIFSSIFRQTQHIYYFFALSGAIWLGGVGAVIIGGLYTRWGSTAGAYAALISGATLALTGMICEQLWKYLYNENFLLTGQEVYFFAMATAVIFYITVSLVGKRTEFNLDKMLHRGKYRVASDCTGSVVQESNHNRERFSLKGFLGITEEFSRGDKAIYAVSIWQTIIIFLLFVVMTTVALMWGLSDKSWANYHYYVFCVILGTSLIIAVWLSWGGIRDVIRLFADLKNTKRDIKDDGSVDKHFEEQNREEKLVK